MLISNINAINQAEIIVVKCLIQENNKVAWVSVEPANPLIRCQLYDHRRPYNDAPTHSATLPTISRKVY